MKFSAQKIFNYIEKSIEADFETCAVKVLDNAYISKFRSSSYSLFSVVEKGEVETDLILADKQARIKRGETVACYIPRETLAKTCPVGNNDVKILWSRINFNILGNLDLLSFFDIPFVLAPETGKQIYSINRQLIELEAKNIQTITSRKKICFELLDLLVRTFPLKPGIIQKMQAVEFFIPVIEYINKNYADKIHNDDLSRIACISTSRFCHKFKETIGVAPQRFIQQLRFREICKLLAETNLSLNEISCKFSYKDQFQFSRAFKSSCGYSPSHYRKLLKKSQKAIFSS
ncbi:MAG: helix-turn-helix transcriptional regulator [Lentisphaerae bacterium]|nr:helix-turn-helix transcriptional regulator [Lentisphaerota bacterium]MCP4102278.1 helix-turn-helix transcriptional regulator [Lentisphaerota bacterium]